MNNAILPIEERWLVFLPSLTIYVVFLYMPVFVTASVSRRTVLIGTRRTEAESMWSLPSRIHGWIDQPDYRGTMDIVWTSLFTIFVCTYTILYLNVPAENESHFPILRRRLWWMTIAIAGPEFILTAACGQWSRANEARKAFRESGYSNWTLRHGFFADMGGLLLVPKDYPPFPVNNRHIHYLVTNNYMRFPDFTEVELRDRSKQDGIAKVITSAQVGYMVIELIGRAGQGLAITTLELSALAIVICSLLTSITWLRKPADVLTPIRLPMNTPIERILIEAGDAAAKPFKQTPLDFVDDLKPSWGLNVQTFMRLPVSPHERPLPRLPNDRLPYLSEPQQALLCLACLVYASVHLLGWNFPFPTRTEMILWRVCSMFLFANTAAFWVFGTVAADSGRFNTYSSPGFHYVISYSVVVLGLSGDRREKFPARQMVRPESYRCLPSFGVSCRWPSHTELRGLI